MILKKNQYNKSHKNYNINNVLKMVQLLKKINTFNNFRYLKKYYEKSIFHSIFCYENKENTTKIKKIVIY